MRQEVGHHSGSEKHPHIISSIAPIFVSVFVFPNHFLKVKMIDIFIPWVITLLRKLFSIGGKAFLGWRGHDSVYMVRFYRTGAEGMPQESLLHKHEGLSLDPRTH